MKRGIRNNNPLNIRHSANRWQGAKTKQTDPSFVQFESMAYGYRAAWKTLQSYYKRFRCQNQPFTVKNIITRWAPPTENNTNHYIQTMLTLSGIGGQECLLPPENMQGYGRLSQLITAMTCMECGTPMSEVDTQAICQGYKLAFPHNARKLDEWLLTKDEYGEW